MTGCGAKSDSAFSRLALSPRGDKVFLADGNASLKILSWTKGVRTATPKMLGAWAGEFLEEGKCNQ